LAKKVILYIASSLDGFIAKKDHDISWLFQDQDYGWSGFEKEFSCAVMGRKSYEFARQFSDPPFKGKKNFVVTTQRELYLSSNDEIIFCSYDDVINYILADPKDEGIYLVGGTGLITNFFNSNMIDEFIAAFHPIILGEGIPLFEGIKNELRLELTEHTVYTSGLVKLKYKVLK
jgi:dihydrofolate reductase